MNWQAATNRVELQSLGPFNEVRAAVKAAIEGEFSNRPLQLKCVARGWDQLLAVISDYRKLNHATDAGDPGPNDPYFQSAGHRAMFALLEMEGAPRLKTLGISRGLFGDAKAANAWYKSTAKLIHPDKNPHAMASAAQQALEKLYGEVCG